jgi:hypothetical protein
MNIANNAKIDTKHFNTYAYAYINYLRNVTLTVGGSVDVLGGEIGGIDISNQFNPKFGITWNPIPSTTVRAAVFRVLKRTLITDQTLEPTQVAGFNQFFDDVSLTESWRYGGAIDQKFSKNVFGGVEISTRDLTVPFIDTSTPNFSTGKADWDEYLARAYLFWTPHEWLALRAEYVYERFERAKELRIDLKNVETHRVPFGFNFFHPTGLSTAVTATYYHQDGEFDTVRQGLKSGSDNFWLVDLALGYRLPRRYGFITLGVTNLANQNFNYYEADLKNFFIQPKRQVFARLTFAIP